MTDAAVPRRSRALVVTGVIGSIQANHGDVRTSKEFLELIDA